MIVFGSNQVKGHCSKVEISISFHLVQIIWFPNQVLSSILERDALETCDQNSLAYLFSRLESEGVECETVKLFAGAPLLSGHLG